jgi:hypothetical protein
MGKLNIKVPVVKLLEGLEKALDERTKWKADAPKRKAQYEKDMATYNKAVLALVKSGKATLKEACAHRWQNEDSAERTINAEFTVKAKDMPKAPQEDDKYPEWRINSEMEELNNAIKLLRMSSDEFVSTSTYKSVVQYL